MSGLFKSSQGVQGSNQSQESGTMTQTSSRAVDPWLMSLLQGEAYGTSGGSKLQQPAVDYLTNLINSNSQVNMNDYKQSTQQGYQTALDEALGMARTRSNGLPIGRAGMREGTAISQVANARAADIASRQEQIRQFQEQMKLSGAGQLGQYAQQNRGFSLALADLLAPQTSTGTSSGVRTGTANQTQTSNPSLWSSIMSMLGTAGGAASGFAGGR